MFNNTGIATYIWILSNRKPEKRKGKAQLIDATKFYKKIRRNLGQKNCELNEDHIKTIVQLYMDFGTTEKSLLIPNKEFGYSKITVERPLRLLIQLTDERLEAMRKTIVQEKKFKKFIPNWKYNCFIKRDLL